MNQPKPPHKRVLSHAQVITITGPMAKPPIRANGSSYRPSNGIEGEIFMGSWCDKCDRDIEGDCPIVAEAMVGSPPQWMHWGDKPLCTEWTPIKPPPKRKPKPSAIHPAQLSLFVGELQSTNQLKTMLQNTEHPTISILAELPEPLQIETMNFLSDNPGWDYDRVFTAAIAVFLMQQSSASTNAQVAAREYISAMFGS